MVESGFKQWDFDAEFDEAIEGFTEHLTANLPMAFLKVVYLLGYLNGFVHARRAMQIGDSLLLDTLIDQLEARLVSLSDDGTELETDDG